MLDKNYDEILELNRTILASESAKLVLEIIENAEGFIQAIKGLNTDAFDALRTSVIYNSLLQTRSDVSQMRVSADILSRESQMTNEEKSEGEITEI